MVRASVVPGFAAVTVNVFACFEGGKQVFLKASITLRNTIKSIRRNETRKRIAGIVVV